MKDMGYAFMFEGIGMKSTKYIHLLNDKQQNIVKNYCNIVENQVGFSIMQCIFDDSDKEEEHRPDLVNQIVVYTLSCAIYDIYKDIGIIPKLLLGHSMGYYAALYASRAVSFETGLMMVINAYKFINASLDNKRFSTVLIIGLTKDHVDEIVTELRCNQFVEIAIENNEHCILISGIEKYVNIIKNHAMKEGAIKIMDIGLSKPYHTHFVEKGALEFLKANQFLDIRNSSIPIISCVDQRILQYSEELREEAYRNIRNQISWKKTILEVGKLGVKKFVEVGLDDGLVRMSKLIHPDYFFLSINKLLIERVG